MAYLPATLSQNAGELAPLIRCTTSTALKIILTRDVYGRPIHSLALRSVDEPLRVIASRAQGCRSNSL